MSRLYMTVHGMQQQLQSSVLMHEHLPACGLTMDPAVEEMELAPEAGIFGAETESLGKGLESGSCLGGEAGLRGLLGAM